MERLREVLIGVINDREIIIPKVKDFIKDENEQREIIKRFVDKLPKKESRINANSFGKENCAELISEIYFVMRTVMNHKTDSRTPSSFRNLLGVIDKAVDIIRHKKNEEISSYYVKLTDQDEKRTYLQIASKAPNGFDVCARCGHKSVDYPNSNTGIKERNDRRKQDFDERLSAFNKQKNPSDKVSIYDHGIYHLEHTIYHRLIHLG